MQNESKTVELPLDKWDDAYLQKEWGAKVKSVTILPDGDYALVVEFLKDFDDVTKLQQAFHKKFSGTVSDTHPMFVFYFFDADNVAVGSPLPHLRLEGEVTGVKGDAVRLIVRSARSAGPDSPRRITRASVRPVKRNSSQPPQP